MSCSEYSPLNRHGAIANHFINIVGGLGRRPDVPGRYCPTQSPQEKEVMDRLEAEASLICKEAGVLDNVLDIKRDPFGSLYIVLKGRKELSSKEEDRRTAEGYCIHSHIDAVERAGDYDGVLGVATGMEMLCRFAEQYADDAKRPDKSLCIIAWAGEESTYTGHACLGSTLACGGTTRESLSTIADSLITHAILRADQKETWIDAMLAFKGTPWFKDGKLYLNGQGSGVKLSMIEPHIQQSKDLFEKGPPVAAVKSIGGSSRWNVVVPSKELTVETEWGAETDMSEITVSISGIAGHTGGTPPNPRRRQGDSDNDWNRHDALLASLDFIRAIRSNKEIWNDLKITSIDHGSDTGFTVIPHLQNLRFACPKQHVNEVLSFLKATIAVVERSCGVTATIDDPIEYTERPTTVIDGNKALAMMSIARAAEITSRRQHKKSGPRMTATDLTISAKGASMKIDARFCSELAVNIALRKVPIAVRRMLRIAEIIHDDHTDLSEYLKNGVFSPFAETDEELNAILHIILEDELRSDGEISLYPGHDTRVLILLAKMRATMLALAHPEGLSHHPDEKCTFEVIEETCIALHRGLEQFLAA